MSSGSFPESALEEEVNVKVRGYLRTARAFAPLMTGQGLGRIHQRSGLAARADGFGWWGRCATWRWPR